MTDRVEQPPATIISFPIVPTASSEVAPKAPPPTVEEKYEAAAMHQRIKETGRQRKSQEGRKDSRISETMQRRIKLTFREMARGLRLQKPREAFRPFKTLLLTDEHKKAIRLSEEFSRFRALVTTGDETVGLTNDCRVKDDGNVSVSIAAHSPRTGDRVKFTATITKDGVAVDAKVALPDSDEEIFTDPPTQGQHTGREQ